MNALHMRYDALPDALLQSSQWICFNVEKNEQGKLTKTPYNARTGRHADKNEARTWVSFEEARAALPRYNYIGYAFTKKDRIKPIDLDKCRDRETGRIDAWARNIIARLNSYTEISLSGTGIHILVYADVVLPERKQKVEQGQIEFYTSGHFLIPTGNHLAGTPTTIEERTDALQSLYDEYFPHVEIQDSFFVDASDVDIEEARQWLTHYAEEHKNSDRSVQFQRLVSAVYLKYGTGAAMALKEDINAASGGKYSKKRIEREIERSLQKAQHLPRTETRHKQAEKTTQSYTWQDKSETKHAREKRLDIVGNDVKARVETHIESKQGVLHVEAVSPGIGKSRDVAELGKEYNIAWIAENHKQIESVKPLVAYRHIEGCKKNNCEYHLAHNELAKRGYPAIVVHKKHDEPCPYSKQFEETGSAVYQLGHVEMPSVAEHDTIIIDELDLSKWIDEREISVSALDKAQDELGNPFCAAYGLLEATIKTIKAVDKTKKAIRGKMLFDVLNTWSKDQLLTWLDELSHNKDAMRERPYTHLFDGTPDELALQAMNKQSVVLPHLIRSLLSERDKWLAGEDWNSCLEIRQGKHGYALFASDVKRFTSKSDTLPPVALLDATADEKLLSLLFAMPVQVHRVAVDPPQHMQHIAIRTGKRYGKTSLTRKSDKDRTRAIAECRYLLHELDPKKQKTVGLITYQGCKDALGDALGIPETRRMHFWNARGSNVLEACDILLVIGTPTQAPDDVKRLARVLYRNDLTPIDETSEEIDGVWTYRDARLQHLSTYLIKAELTQCSHRNRALRHDERVVVTMCNAEIDYLPITEEYSALPQLATDGQERGAIKEQEQDTRLDEAAARLVEQGKKISVRNLMQEAHIKRDTAAAWCQQHMYAAVSEKEKSVPRFAINNIYSKTGYTFDSYRK